jgi:ribonuclease R
MEEALRLGKHCSMTERRAERAERELIRLKLLAYFESRLGEQMEAVITGVDRFGFFCRGIEIPAEGLVHISALSQDEYFDYDRVTQSLIARGSGKAYRLGDRVRVEVVRVDVDRRELNFVLVKANSRNGSPRRASGKGASSGKRGQKETQTRSRPRRKK